MSQSNQTPQTIPVAFAPKFVWVGVLDAISRMLGYVPFSFYSDYDDTQTPSTQGEAYQLSAWATPNFPWRNTDDVIGLSVTETGFTVQNCNLEYENVSKSIHYDYCIALNGADYTYFYLAIG